MFDIPRPFSTDPLEDVAVVVTPLGAGLLPASVQKLTPTTKSRYLALCDDSQALYELELSIAKQVKQLRRSEVPWSAIGWALGISGDAARKRFTDV